MAGNEGKARPAPDLDAYAVLLAYVQRFPDGQAEVLAKFGWTPEQWTSLRTDAQKAIGEAGKRKDSAVLTHFAKATGAARERIGERTLEGALSRAPKIAAPSAVAPAITAAPAAPAASKAASAPASNTVEAPSPKPAAAVIEYAAAVATAADAPRASWTPDAVTVLPPSVTGEPRLSIQQYASLRAEVVAASAGGVDEVRGRYGLDESGDAAEVEAWGRKFAQSPETFERYKSLFQYFRGLARSGE